MTDGLGLAWMSPMDAARRGVGAGRVAAVEGGLGARVPRARRLRAAALPAHAEPQDDQAGGQGRGEAERRQPRGQGAHPPHPARDGAAPDARATSRRRRSSSPTRRTSRWRSSTAAARWRRRRCWRRARTTSRAQIRERARKHGIPIVENKPLAQALYKTAEVGDTIPAPLFAAVAEVLAQLIS